MRNIKLLALLLAVFLLIGCCSCGANNKGNDDDEVPDISDLTPAEISELAMNNFIKKLQAETMLQEIPGTW